MEGLVVGGLGGAFSVDYHHRTEGKDWWPNEEPTQEEAEKLVAGGPLDILITHDAPSGVPLKGDFQLQPELTKQAERTRILCGSCRKRASVPILALVEVGGGNTFQHWAFPV